MGNQKLKWTAEEEKALLDGIEKHGSGKWKNILRDPEFTHRLTSRSNIDLKDKWRNMCVAPGSTQGSNYRPRPIKVKEEAVVSIKVKEEAVVVPGGGDVAIVIPPPNVSPSSELSIDDSSNSLVDNKNILVDNKNAPRYDGMIYEALLTLADANGSDVGSIFNYIEPRHEVPPNFRRTLSSRLRRMATQGKLLKLQNLYKMPEPSGTKTYVPAPSKPKETINIKFRQSINQPPPVTRVMIEEAGITAAYKLVEAENKIDVARGAIEELNKMTKLAEETELLMELAKEMHELCSHGEVVLLA
ncbi:hypothetical protein AALP_AA2G161200 [Arabis alpina]|uniref:MYB transcription factor n=1 Tax=Arabis alpina TaxID=50452 RepID=A0A087HHU5_ARAAL|nr:hypothetical protein AALP_AA2G161200 [Arabis alpina]